MSSDAIWLVGCGNMAGAMLGRWLSTGLDPARITVIDPNSRRHDVRVLATVPDELPPAMVMLGVKPQMLADVVPAIQAATRGALLLSILAGTTAKALRNVFPGARAIARIMPNLPVAIGKGVVALHGNLAAEDRKDIEVLMSSLGLVEWIDEESLFDVVTALSGSGPAFVYRYIDALAKGGAALGLPADQALRLATATVDGAGSLAGGSDDAPHNLAERVASKGGSTRAALDVLDDRHALTSLVAQALAAAAQRNRELAELSSFG